MWKLLNLPATDRRLLINAVLLLGAIRLGLWLLPFQTLRQLLAKMTQNTNDARLHKVMAGRRSQAEAASDAPPRPSPALGRVREGDAMDAIVWAVVVASRYVPRSTCLTQALTAQVLLARRGVPASLHIGVAKEGAEARFGAHAWVESEGKVLIGGSEPGRYTPLLALEGEEQ